MTVLDLTARIRAAIDEAERIARRAAGHHPRWVYDPQTMSVSTADSPHHSVAAKKANGWGLADVDGEHIALHDPERELRIIAGHRTILAEHEAAEPDYQVHPWTVCTTCVPDREWPCTTLLAVAGIYSVGVEEEEKWDARPQG